MFMIILNISGLPLVIVAALLGPTHDDYLREEMKGMEMRAT